MNTWVLDFETYYKDEHGGEKYSIEASNIVRYVKDQRWKVHGLAVLFPSGESKFIQESEISSLLEAIKPEDLVLAHNWAFDGFAFAHHYGWRHWKVTDTMLLSYAVLGTKKDRGSGNSLGELAKELGLEAKGRLDPMEGVRDLSEDQWAYLALYAKTDVRLCKQIHDILLPRLRNQRAELWLLRHSLNLFINRPIKVSASRVKEAANNLAEWTQASIDKVMKGEVIPDTPECQGGTLMPLITDVLQLSSEKQFAEIITPILKANNLKLPMKQTEQAIKKPTKPERKKDTAAWDQYDRDIAAFRPGKINVMIPALAKADPGFQKLQTCGITEIENLCEARIAYKSSSTIKSRLSGINTDQVHMSLIYHGAGTGRWTGGGNGWNPQNIPSPARATTEEQAQLSRALRSCLIPRPGYQFVHVDLAQAEARVVAWLAGQWDLVEQFKRGEDVYCSFISDALGRRIEKPEETDKSEAAREMAALRAVGKEGVLSLIFGVGQYKYFDRLRAIPAVRLVLGDKISINFARTLVEAFRSRYEYIPRFWKLLEQGFQTARKGQSVQVGALRFEPGDREYEDLWLVYPCGRRIPFSNVRQIKDQRDRLQWISGNGKKIYGGLLMNTSAQGTARDILAGAMPKLEKQQLKICLSTHDSLDLEVPEERAEEALKSAIDFLRTPPWWGPQLVLDAEGHISGDFN